jgi:AraC family transcriptional regulator
MDWRPCHSDRVRSKKVARGDAHLGDGLPIWVRTHGWIEFFAVAMDRAFVNEIWNQEFGQACSFDLRAAIGIRDVVIGQIGRLARKELQEGCIEGRLYTESLGTALAVHLLRQYSTTPKAPMVYKGGLAARPLRRVVEHINEHLQDELSLLELSRLANLSPHRFAAAFRASVGLPPHRYVIERRVDLARDLLRRHDKPISEIAYAVGFSSQSHLTTNFRRTTGVTPRQFRQSLG